MTNFCPICGKDTEKTFCEEHEEISLDYKDIEVKVCECKRYFYRNKWLPFESLKSVVKKITTDNIKQKVKVKPIIEEDIVKQRFEIEINYQGKTFLIPAKLIVEKCPQCSKLGTQYFESIIQLRPKDKELLDFVKKQIQKIENAFISKIEEKKDGWDLYSSSNKASLQVGSKLKKSFKGELKTSRKLFTYDNQRSRNLYRVTVFFRKS